MKVLQLYDGTSGGTPLVATMTVRSFEDTEAILAAVRKARRYMETHHKDNWTWQDVLDWAKPTLRKLGAREADYAGEIV